MRRIKPCVLTIAGSDSSGGAGIQADIKAISATGCYAASAITALTAQNTQGVQSIHDIPAHFLSQQVRSVLTDMPIQAIKIGMLHNQEIIAAVAALLLEFQIKKVVLDPVMLSKNGCALIDPATITYLQDALFPLVMLITPNLPEAEKILAIKITNSTEQEWAAKALGVKFKVNVLIKGGHFSGSQSSDVVYLYASNSCYWFHSDRICSPNTHGTGCSLSAAIASYLAQNIELVEAIHRAKQYLTQAIYFAKQQKIGKGCGPVEHFYILENK